MRNKKAKVFIISALLIVFIFGEATQLFSGSISIGGKPAQSFDSVGVTVSEIEWTPNERYIVLYGVVREIGLADFGDDQFDASRISVSRDGKRIAWHDHIANRVRIGNLVWRK